MNARPLVIVLHGPSGVGKDAVIDRLRERTGIHRATSTTSRLPRPNEVNGNHYHFVSAAEFEEKIRAGEFAEWARVYDDYKGLERLEVEQPLRDGRDVIIRTDVQGARTWRERLEGAIFVFLMAEDREALRTRLASRGSEDAAAQARRIGELEEELADIENNDHVVYNRHGQLEETVDEIERIIRTEKRKRRRPAARLLV